MHTSEIAERLCAHGIQPTAQRRRIAAVLLSAPQHMSAEQLLAQLDLFASRGLIRPLTVDGARVWFDSNVEAHYHFHDVESGALTDVAVPEVEFSRLPRPPAGMEVAGIDLVIRLRKAPPG